MVIFSCRETQRRQNCLLIRVPKNKLCKCNSHENIENTKIAAKEGNAEERPDAGCKIYGEEQRLCRCFVSANQSPRQTKTEPDKMIRLQTTTGYYEQL